MIVCSLLPARDEKHYTNIIKRIFRIFHHKFLAMPSSK